jgi:adenosylhomocysteine nucleosidase
MAPTFVVGLAAEARIARPLGWPVATGGGSYEGAVLAAEQAARAGARALISFGLAGGLDPALRPGTLVAPEVVIVDDARFAVDPALRGRLGVARGGTLFGATAAVAHAARRHGLLAQTGACAVDLESGAVARVARRHGIPFAVLRAICDPAERDLPPAALIALDRSGNIGMLRLLASVLAHPAQIPALGALAADARAARTALRAAIARIS